MSTVRHDRLILHAGMHKTGSSSIQETLFFGLTDRRFRYIGFGEVNGSRAIKCLVGADPARFHLNVAQGLDGAKIGRLCTTFARRWRQAAARAREAGAIPIVSAEACWMLPEDELTRLRDMIQAAGFVAEVIIYLRPPLGDLGSSFQQRVKSGKLAGFDPLHEHATYEYRPYDYCGRLAAFETVFGRSQLMVRPFRRETLADGCAVTDFCRALDIAVDPRAIRRVNEGLSLEATRILYAYNRFGHRDGLSWHEDMLLRARLRDLKGTPFRLHPEVIAPVLPMLSEQLRALRERHGIDLSEDWDTAAPDAVKTEADLFRFSRASLDWLAAAAGARAIRDGEGPDAARQVSEQVSRLRRRPSWRALRQRVHELSRREFRRIVAGV